MEFVKRIFDVLGSNMPLLMILANIILLQKKTYYQYFFVVFVIINVLLNTFLKQCLKQPRPSIDDRTFQMMLKKSERFVRKHGMPYDIFGMPSGHAQSTFFSTVYNYLVFRNVKMTAIFLFFCFLTMFQRVLFNHHTIGQVVAGAVVGIALAYLVFELAKKNIGGKFSPKKEDNAYF